MSDKCPHCGSDKGTMVGRGGNRLWLTCRHCCRRIGEELTFDQAFDLRRQLATMRKVADDLADAFRYAPHSDWTTDEDVKRYDAAIAAYDLATKDSPVST